MPEHKEKANTPSAIVMLGCFDTKAADFAYLRSCLLAQGESVIAINTGIYGSTDRFPVDIEAAAVAAAAGHDLQSLRDKSDRGHAVDVMGRGAAVVIGKLAAEGRLNAAVGMGGGGGTYLALAAMQAIPLGIPKVCLSTVASKDLSKQVGNKDITLIPSVVDVAGLNSISRRLIAQTAAAVRGMANATLPEADSNEAQGRIGISMFGNTTACVQACTSLLEARGYEVFVFHANGVGGRTMESLIREDCFDGILDLTTTELADELCGGICSAGPERMQAAAEKGIPQVVAPGCMDMVNFAHMESVPPSYRERKLYSWAPDVTLMRTNDAENRQLGQIMARKINASTAGTAVLLPLRGLSQIDAESGIFHSPDANQALFDTIKASVSERITVREIDAHINDESFAHEAVTTLLELMANNRVQ